MPSGDQLDRQWRLRQEIDGPMLQQRYALFKKVS